MFERISIQQALELKEQSSALVVDIRDPQSYANGHIPDSIHLTNDNVAEFVEQTDKTLPVVVVCYHGNSSQSAAQFLAEQGFEQVFSMDGGVEAWKHQYPVSQ